MRLILNQPLFIPVLTLAFFGLILLAPLFRAAAPTYAYLVDDWDMLIGTGRLLNIKNLNTTFHLVSLPGGVTVRRWYGVNRWIEDLIAAPNRELGIFQGADNGFPQTGNIVQLWDGGLRTFAFDQQLRQPNVWSPDSAYLTVGVHRPCDCNLTSAYVDLGIVDVNSSDLRMLTDGAFIAQENRSVAWSPDGTALVYVDQQFDPSMTRADMVNWIPLDGSQPPRTLFTRAASSGTWLRWLPDGEHIAVIAMATFPELWFIHVPSGQTAFHYTATEPFQSCWSPTTDHFIAASEAGFALITPDGLPPLDISFVDPSIWKGLPAVDVACVWSPDGSKLTLVQRNPPSVPLVHVIDFEKRAVNTIHVDHPAFFLIPYWSPDSRMLALKTYRPFLNSGDTYIYDTTPMQQIYYQTHANFLTWLPEIP